MKVRIDKRYLLLPVGEAAQPKRLTIRAGGEVFARLTLRLSAQPDYVMPYDLRALLGREAEISVEPEAAFEPVFSDETGDIGLRRERYRPAAHFTAPRGWINDPNGLALYEGQYHLFYQHNPVDTVWGNMHWGHAVSSDLVHWEDLEEALFPDETGAMFSGSAVADTDNRTGLRENEHAPLLLYYTAACDRSTQRMAYSTDGGKTFRKYGRPMVDTITPGNRDPKVVFCDEMGCYLMALYLDGREFCLFSSDNLLDWKEIQRVFIEEEDECPDLYPLTDEAGRRHWVMTGAHDRYLVGQIEGGRFIAKQSTGRLHYGLKSYAAQTFSGVPGGRRIRFGWNQSHIPGMPFTGAMTTPHDMTLKRIDGRLTLCAWPSAEFEALRGKKAEGEGRLALCGRANDIELLIPAKGARSVALFGLTLEVDGEAGEVRKAPTPGRVFAAGRDDGAVLPVRRQDGFIRLRLIQDVHSIEVYAGDGEATLCLEHVSDGLFNRVECDGAKITAWALEDIHA